MKETFQTIGLFEEPLAASELLDIPIYIDTCRLYVRGECPDQNQEIANCHRCPSAIEDQRLFMDVVQEWPVAKGLRVCPKYGKLNTPTSKGYMTHNGVNHMVVVSFI